MALNAAVVQVGVRDWVKYLNGKFQVASYTKNPICLYANVQNCSSMRGKLQINVEK